MWSAPVGRSAYHARAVRACDNVRPSRTERDSATSAMLSSLLIFIFILILIRSPWRRGHSFFLPTARLLTLI